jgi:Ca2+-binding EF-hand superfamily protein
VSFTGESFNQEDCDKVCNAFDEWDLDRDGLISLQCLAELCHAARLGPRADEGEDMIEVFLSLVSRYRCASNRKQELIDAFRLWDRNGIRMLTTTKIREQLSGLKKTCAPDEIAELLGHPRTFAEAKTDSMNYEEVVNFIFDGRFMDR